MYSKVVLGNQNLEVETEFWLLTIKSGGIKTSASPGTSIGICTGLLYKPTITKVKF